MRDQIANQTLSDSFQQIIKLKETTIMGRPNTDNTADQTVTRSSSELSPQEFIRMLDSEVGTKQHLAAYMPEFFWQQAVAGCSHFIVPTEMIQDRLVNIVLEQPTQINDSTVSIKFRLSALMDNQTFNFVPLSKNNQNVNAGWLSGFRSLSIDLGDDVVAKGYLTSEEIDYLKIHAEFYNRVGNEAYSKDREYTKTRPYLSNVEGKSGEFLFLCDVRLRPLNNEEKIQIEAGAHEDDFQAARESIGIILKGWTPGAFRLIGKVSETVSIDSRSGGTLDEPVKAVRGNWTYKRP